jgi:long-subunit fatty acid transport protein
MNVTVLKPMVLAATFALLQAMPAAAQSTDASVFDFSLPGARSRGMGGAFVAIADDASSVYSNPAGLTSLFRPEVSIEGRVWNLRFNTVDHGHAFGSPTNIGADNISGLRDREFSNTIGSPAFLSAVYPSGRWAVGLFHHRLVNYDMSHEIQGPFFDCRGGGRGANGAPPFCEQGNYSDGVDRVFPFRREYQLGITSTGMTVALRATERLKLGVSAQVLRFDLHSSDLVYAARFERKYAAADWSPENLEIAGVRMGKDAGIGFNAGVLWDVSAELTIGATFRQGEEFKYLSQSVAGRANTVDAGIMFLNEPDTSFRVPDTWAAGIAVKPNNSWRIGFEYDRIQYRQLLDTYINTTIPDTWPEARIMREHITVDNSDQFRLGAEYSRPAFGGRLLSFRAGVWIDPFHDPYFKVTDPATGFPAPQWALTLPKGEDEMHYSGGLGMATQRRLQIDLAVDHARSVTTYSLSSIVRF